jgi:hypothetical protein
MVKMTINKLKKLVPKGTVEIKAILWDLGRENGTVSIKDISKLVKALKKEHKEIKNFRLKIEQPVVYYESDAQLAEVSLVGDRPETQKEYIFRLNGQLLAHKEYCMKQNRKCIHGWQ